MGNNLKAFLNMNEVQVDKYLVDKYRKVENIGE